MSSASSPSADRPPSSRRTGTHRTAANQRTRHPPTRSRASRNHTRSRTTRPVPRRRTPISQSIPAGQPQLVKQPSRQHHQSRSTPRHRGRRLKRTPQTATSGSPKPTNSPGYAPTRASATAPPLTQRRKETASSSPMGRSFPGGLAGSTVLFQRSKQDSVLRRCQVLARSRHRGGDPPVVGSVHDSGAPADLVAQPHLARQRRARMLPPQPPQTPNQTPTNPHHHRPHRNNTRQRHRHGPHRATHPNRHHPRPTSPAIGPPRCKERCRICTPQHRPNRRGLYRGSRWRIPTRRLTFPLPV